MAQNSTLLVASFAKSGRSWLRVMLDDLGVQAEYDHLGGHYTRPRYFSGIDGSAFSRHGSVVGLIRNPLDTVVSGYYQCRFRNENFTGSLSEFIASPRHGIERIVRYNLALVEAVSGSPRAMVVQYEELHSGAAAILEKVARLVGFPISGNQAEAVAANCTFDRLKLRESNGELRARYGAAFGRKYPDEPNSGKLPRGLVGGHLAEMAHADAEYCRLVLVQHQYEERIATGIELRTSA